MTKISGTDVIRIFEEGLNESIERQKTLLIALGVLGDFDSIEYTQLLLPILQDLKDSKINFYSLVPLYIAKI